MFTVFANKMIKNKTLATFRIDVEEWDSFKNWADSKNSNASIEIVNFIRSCIGITNQTLYVQDIDNCIINYLENNLDSYLDKKLTSSIDGLIDTSADVDRKINEVFDTRFSQIRDIQNEMESLLVK